MTVALTATWEPRGELKRFERLIPFLRDLYSEFVVVMSPLADRTTAYALSSLGVSVVKAKNWAHGRYVALEHGAALEVTHLHYADLDRLIRWAEVYPDELHGTLERLQTCHCLMMNRSDYAQETHPRALRDTEVVINSTFSYLLGQRLDFSSGAKGLSREAARFLLTNTSPAHVFGSDTEWPVLLQRAGVTLESVWLDGLDWETADRFRDSAADAELQRTKAAEYDADPQNWAYRAFISQVIADAGIAAFRQTIDMNGWTP